MRRIWRTSLLAVIATVGLMVLAWGVALADDPTDSSTAEPAGEIYYKMAENLYSLHDTRLQSCFLCHAGGAPGSGAAVTGLNAYGNDLLAQLQLSVSTAAYGNSTVDVTSPVTITNALKAIESHKPGGDTVANGQKLWALTFPGNPADKYTSEPAPASVALGPHGGYGSTPDQCAICHRTHTAQAPFLLTQNQQALCYTCHALAGANTDVRDGTGVAGAGLKGGGFMNAVMDTSLSGTPASHPSTSSHVIDGSPAMMWGNGTYTTTVSAGKAGVTLECGNCHDPHMPTWTPDGGTTVYNQYRMLQGDPRESGTVGQSAVGGHGWYLSIPEAPIIPGSSVLFPTNHGVPISYTLTYVSSTDPNQNNRPLTSYQPTDRIGEFCALCHTRYMTSTVVANSADPYASVPEELSTGDPVFMYQHATKESSCTTCHVSPPAGMQPPADATHKDAWSRPRCLDCHVAHGTAATMGTNSAAVPWPGGVTPVAAEGSQRSSLLRLNNRGVCTQCHEK